MAYLLLVMLLPLSALAQDTKSVKGGLSQQDFWKMIKRELTDARGRDYFENNFKNAMVPGGAGGLTSLTGTLLSAEPPDRPSVLIVALSDRTTPEVKLQLKNGNWKDTHLNGPLAPGSQITFEGVPVAFTTQPFMLTFDVSTTTTSKVYFSRPPAAK